MDRLLLGNIISLAGALIMVASGLIKNRKGILLMQSLQFAVMGVGNWILGAVSGTVANFCGMARNLYCVRHTLPTLAGVALVGVQAVIAAATNTSGFIGWLPVVASVGFTLSVNSRDELVLKAALIFGQILWTVYDFWFRNYASVVFDILTILSAAAGIVLVLRGRKQKAEKSRDRLSPAKHM